MSGTLAADVTAVVTCLLLVTWWSRGSSADDVIVSSPWLQERLSSVIILEATRTFDKHPKKAEHIPGQSVAIAM